MPAQSANSTPLSMVIDRNISRNAAEPSFRSIRFSAATTLALVPSFISSMISQRVSRSVRTSSRFLDRLAETTVSISQCPNVFRLLISSERSSIPSPFGSRASCTFLYGCFFFFPVGRLLLVMVANTPLSM